MSEQEAQQPQLPLAGVGPRLKAAREQLGITREGMAQKTRIAERLIAAIEAGDWDALPSRTYATGFTRSYARAVGLDEKAIVSEVRREMGLAEPVEYRAGTASLDPGDPARVPGSKFAWGLALLAIVLAIGGYFAFRTLFSPAVVLPETLPIETASAEVVVTTEASVPAIYPSLGADGTLLPTDGSGQTGQATAPRRVESRPSVRPATRASTPASPTPQPAPAPAPAAEQGSVQPPPSTVSN
ncbi:helix-turn-helix domain-containing protein [Novosphingobium sp.]|uniref:helix-turn-helix domain-containing protein n=1 Tax=Novosphingobium sp. TaxID=1874826 RepID=UPI00286E1E08|nr:helix-turn-helix domain-containing protein [Novosphingobium sp.]